MSVQGTGLLRRATVLALAAALAATLVGRPPSLAGAGASDSPAWPVHEQRSLRLESFHADIVVRPDGSMRVTETLRPRFTGSWNGIFRNLSLRHRTARGMPARLKVEILSVTDGEGTDLEVERESGGAWTRRLRIWVPGATDATRTVVIRYRVANALRFFDSEDDPGGIHDELYWNVTGNAWEIPIDRASVEVTLPPEASVSEAWAYTGPEGSTARDADVTAGGARVEAVAQDALRPGDGLTLSVSFPPGTVPRPGAMARAVGSVRMWWPAGVPFLAFLVMGRAWMRHGRDPKRRAIAVRYEPPDDLRPAEAGTLVDHRAQMHDLTSTLVDLAVRGWVRIEETVEKRFLGLKRDRSYTFHLLRPRTEWSELRAHERRFLGALFRGATLLDSVQAAALRKTFVGRLLGRHLEEGPGDGAPDSASGSLDRVDLADLENRFYRSLEGIKNAVYDRLKAEGHYRSRPDRVTALFVSAAIVLAMLGAFGAVVSQVLPVFVANPGALLAGALVSAAIVFFFGLLMPARTVKGARTREATLGFKEFLEKVEEPRYRRMIKSPDDFERYLPYAMAFRVEDQWARAFEDLYREPPDWYTGSDPARGFRASDFTSRLNSMTQDASSTFASSPSSSGSGGGGSSGGGSGGGGGGGF